MKHQTWISILVNKRKGHRTTIRSICLGALATVALLSACSSESSTFPEFTAPVVDSANALDDAIEASLSSELEAFRVASGPQIAVAVIDTTGSSSIEDYTIDLARQWQVGDAQRDDGVLILVALDDRKLRIEVGSGVEGDLTDVAAGRIIDTVMLPLLRNDDVNGAVVQGAQAVMSVWRGEAITPPASGGQSTDVPDAGFGSWLIVLLFFVFIGGSIALALFGVLTQHTTWTSGESRSGYGGIFTSGGFGSSGRGFGGGGGFSGGFGGGFSGGGAGGSW